MQVRGDMVDANGPMGPDQMTWGGWWSVLRTLGSAHPRVKESLSDDVKAHQLTRYQLDNSFLDDGFTRKCPLCMHILYVIYASVNKILFTTCPGLSDRAVRSFLLGLIWRR